MREKYNAMFPNSINSETSYIQRYLGPELETILNPEANSIHGVDFDSLYVHMPVEEKFNIYRSNTGSDRCVFLTGITGCGKSSLLNHFFYIEKESIHINKRLKSLYISFTFDHAIAAREKLRVEKYFINQIKTACEKVEIILKQKNLIINNYGLYRYIESIRPDTLRHGDGINTKTEEERLDELNKNEPIEYYALLLKYYLTVLKEIDNVVLIVDDIESVGHQMELLPIDIGLSLWSCFKHQPKNVPKVWSSCVIISCRHYVYRMIQKHSIDERYVIKSGIDSQTLESYPIDNEINIYEPANLREIIVRRVEALNKKKDNKRWDDAWKVVEQILLKVDDKFGDFVQAICINNIRKTLDVLKKVVLNKRWIQRNWQEEETAGAFNIKSLEQYHLSPPCLLRAISLGEGNTYDENSFISNIMFNVSDKNSDLITLMVLKAFINKSNENAVDWRTSLDRYKIVHDIKEVLIKKETHPYIELAVEYLIKNRLFLRSKNQSQDDGLDINESNIKFIEKIYVSKGAFALWNQLGRSSVLFELYSDDIYIDYESEIIEKQSFSLFDSNSFKKCIELLSELVEIEKEYRIDAKNAGLLKKMNGILGVEFVTKQLFNGLIASRNAYYKTTGEYASELDLIKEKISYYKNLLENT